jgi:HK97 family phage major capsid protein
MDDTANVGEIAAEGAAGASGDDLVFGTNSLGAYKYTSLGASNLELKVSVELLQDSAFDVQALVTRALGIRIGRKMATDFINGSGSGEPLGILTAASDVTGTTGLAPTYPDIVSLVHGVDKFYRQGASFLVSDGGLAKLQQVVDANDRPLWMPSTGGLGNGLPEGTMLGYPVIVDQAMPTATPIVNDENWLIFGNLREAYVIRHVKDVTVIVDPYTYAKEGQVGFVAWARADGTIQNAAAYAQLEGTT